MNIIYLNTTEKKPSGGSNTIYRHSNIINNFKITNLTSEVLHLRKSKFSKFKTSIKKNLKYILKNMAGNLQKLLLIIITKSNGSVI
jgi:hypothetical protein